MKAGEERGGKKGREDGETEEVERCNVNICECHLFQENWRASYSSKLLQNKSSTHILCIVFSVLLLVRLSIMHKINNVLYYMSVTVILFRVLPFMILVYAEAEDASDNGGEVDGNVDRFMMLKERRERGTERKTNKLESVESVTEG